MDYKKTNAAQSIITRDLNELDTDTGNIYEAIAIIAKRANQMGVGLKEELTAKLAEFASTTDNLEEIFENREQIEISKFYERLPKPTSMAIQEFLEERTYYRQPETEEEEVSEEDK
ncbi:MAG: DNA-directed RNA polymerase subunit omega [Flavobacteriales bacterium]|nr:DNA-directed RNA polymerase subunit omega [Flavobacteriales bacterium]